MDQQLLARLRAVVDEDFPATNDAADPQWSIHTIFGSPAPTVTLSRDPRAGERLSPVYFVATADEASCLDLATRIFGLTGRFAKLRHTLQAPDGLWYLFVLPMFHLDKVADFTAALDAALAAEAERQPLAWVVEPCETIITKDLLTWSLRSAHDGSPTRVVTRDLTIPKAG